MSTPKMPKLWLSVPEKRNNSVYLAKALTKKKVHLPLIITKQKKGK